MRNADLIQGHHYIKGGFSKYLIEFSGGSPHEIENSLPRVRGLITIGLMKLFTVIVSSLFVVIGVWAILDGNTDGWSIAGFFGLCLLVAIFEPWLSKPPVCEYELVITEDEVACEHPTRKRESIRWADVNQIWYITTADGPRFPHEWLLFEGENGGCSFPTEARGMDGIWDELKQRFAGFDYKPIIHGETDYAKHLCWERRQLTSQST